MAKLEKMEELLSDAGGEKRYIDGFRNGTIWAYNEMADFLKTYISEPEHLYIDESSAMRFLLDFRNHLTSKEIE